MRVSLVHSVAGIPSLEVHETWRTPTTVSKWREGRWQTYVDPASAWCAT